MHVRHSEVLIYRTRFFVRLCTALQSREPEHMRYLPAAERSAISPARNLCDPITQLKHMWLDNPSSVYAVLALAVFLGKVIQVGPAIKAVVLPHTTTESSSTTQFNTAWAPCGTLLMNHKVNQHASTNATSTIALEH